MQIATRVIKPVTKFPLSFRLCKIQVSGPDQLEIAAHIPGGRTTSVRHVGDAYGTIRLTVLIITGMHRFENNRIHIGSRVVRGYSTDCLIR